MFRKISALTLALVSLVSAVWYSVSAYADDADTTSFVGIKKSRTAKILDNFKESEKEILFEKAPFTAEEEFGIFDSESQIRVLEQMKQRIENTKNSLKEQKLEVTTRKFTLTTMLADLDASISKNEQEITDAEERIRDKNKTIADTIRNIAQLQDRIDANKEVILGYLSYLYSKGDMVYDGENQVDVIRTLVLSDGNLSDILWDIHFKTILEVTGQNFIEERRALVKDYYMKTATLKEDKAKIITLKKDLQAKRLELDEQKAYKLQLLSITQGQETLFNQYIADHQEKEHKVEARLTVAIAAYDGAFQEVANRHGCKLTASGGVIVDKSSTPKCADLRQYYDAEKNLRDHGFDDTAANPFEWPVTPKYISSYYKDADYYGSVGSEHEAIDIPAEQGTDIVAPAPGYVYYVNEPTQNGYGYVALKHSNGYVTVYGHVSEVTAKKFDFIDKGQVFAKSGGAPGTKGAGVMTSGAHLHFEVHHSRETVDPLRLMDLTKLRFESLATKYKYKFVEDLKLRYGYMANTDKYNTFSILGDTEIERQKYLLKTYAGSDFRDWDTWTEEAVEAKLDPSFLMCIGLAETGLGRSLKTQYNVGNIGNTDSWATSAFISARDGIYWMGKTLNNRFLGKYESLSDLSRWGNKDKSIYASSPKNWHENMVRCLSALKGRFVEDDYKFRINPTEDIDSSVADANLSPATVWTDSN